MPQDNRFKIILLIARPAAGKSEIIDYLRRTSLPERVERFHVGEFEEIDDFPMLWTWFEEDHILEELGHPRLHTDENNSFKYKYLWDVLIQRISLEYAKKLRDKPAYHEEKTTIIEFARGTQHGGFQRAFEHLSQEILEKMAVVYVSVSWEESLRKNRQRYNPERQDSILEHGLPDSKLEKLYREMDWEEVSAGDEEYLTIQGVRVPYVVFENEDDVTTERGEALGQRLEDTLDHLWGLGS
ncbi:MAG: hypothetical protein MAG431_02110 [Chloroflexi bacterium]|nr:hypothetical protein [Chloroflexota bacterium]